MEIKISVVIPTYKREKLLLNALDALSNQHFSNTRFEVIVVHDGPYSWSQDFLQARAGFPFSFWVLNTESKKGPAAARNFGWLRAKGELIVFTDDDCLPDPFWLTLLWEAYQGEQEVALVGKVKVPIQGRRLDFANNLSRLEVAEFITANCACTAKALQKVGGFDERFTLAWREDSDLHFKILSSGIPIKQTQALVVHPVRKAPWWISLKEQRKVFFNILLKKKFPALYFQRIQASPLLLYYSTVFSFLLVLVSLVSRENSMAKFFFLLWVSLVFLLVIKRLRNASLHLDNVLQVTLTSLLIPFLSTYWRLLGLFKFRRIAAAE